MRMRLLCLLVLSLWISAPIFADEPAQAEPAKDRAVKEEAVKEEAKAQDEKPAKVEAEAKKTPAAKRSDVKKAPPVKKTPPAKAPPVKKLVRFTLRGELPEVTAAPALFAELQISLSTLVERLEAAAEDKDVAAVWLRIEGVEIGRGKVNELRSAVAAFRKSGKPIFAELTTAEVPQYLVASACDKVFLVPNGALMLPGVRAEIAFYKGLLDKIGVEFDMMQMGKYKGAAEPLAREGMSEPFRENLTTVVDDYYEQLVETIAADRHLKDYQVKSLVDQGLFTAAAAKKAGLVDEIAYPDQLQESCRTQLKLDALALVTNYRKKQVDTDFSGIGGLMKLMEMLGGGGKPQEKPAKGKSIAVVYAVGPIIEGKSESGAFGESTLGSTTLVNALKKAGDDKNVVAIVLRIDSPGGSAIASDLIWRETQRIAKPIIASMGDVAGSGGYYIAMGADKIVAEPGTLTGSIGVVSGKVVVKKLFDKLGLKTEVVSRGALSGVESVVSKFSDAEREAWAVLMQDCYAQFVDKAAAGRHMPREKLEELAQGRIYSGRQAAANGLVDRLGTLHDAIVEAKAAAGLKADEKVDVQVLPEPKSFFEDLFGGGDMSGELDTAMAHRLGLPELVALGRKLELLRALFAEPVIVWMPYEIDIK